MHTQNNSILFNYKQDNFFSNIIINEMSDVFVINNMMSKYWVIMTAQRNSSTQGGTRDVSHMFKLLTPNRAIRYHVVDLKFYT